MNIAWLSPLPPVRSGIASYSAMLLPEIAKLAKLTAVVDQPEIASVSACRVIGIEEFRRRRDEFDAVICQVGNNIHHEFVWREASQYPSVLVLHEVVLHHLITEITLARGDSESFISLLKESDGIAGEAFARGRASGHHFEEGNFLFPASAALASTARAIIVHNEWARGRLCDAGVRTPITVIDHPLDSLKIVSPDSASSRLREEHRFPSRSRVIGMFGFVTQPKRPHVVFEALSRALKIDDDLRLLVVGEAASNIDLSELANRFGVPDDAWSSTGWTTDQQFDDALLGVDRVVSLRYPSAGESSGAIARVFAAGKPLAVSDYAQFAELPGGIVEKIPLGEHEVERLVEFMTEPLDTDGIASRQRRWIETHGDPARIAREYLSVVGASAPGGSARQVAAHVSTFGLMPELAVTSFSAVHTASAIEIGATIINRGEGTLRSHNWGSPAYRVIVKLVSQGREIASEWWPLPADLRPGDSVVLSGRMRGESVDMVQFVHGLFTIPMCDETPFFTGEVTR